MRRAAFFCSAAQAFVFSQWKKTTKTRRKEKTMNPLAQFKKISILPLFIAMALIALASPRVTRADAVTDWNAIASDAIVVTALQPPPVSVRSFAMVQGAVYDAVNAID